MQTADFEKFSALIADVHAFYQRDISTFAMNVWWEAMKPYDLAAVSQAMNRHCMNPDSGQFMPKPADVVKMLSGTTQDSALHAWSKVDKALRQVGPYRSVAFDDPLIHAVLHEMGGWVSLGTKTDDEWPFVAKEFENRYRGYKQRNQVPEYKRVLVGITDAHNEKEGYAKEPVMMIGDKAKVESVMLGGSALMRLQVSQEEQAPQHITKLLEKSERAPA